MSLFSQIIKLAAAVISAITALACLTSAVEASTISGAWRADTSFRVRLENEAVGFFRTTPLGDGRLMVFGDMTSIGTHECRSIAVLKSDFTVDEGFSISTNGYIYDSSVSPDRKYLYISGRFSYVNGVVSPNLARISIADNVVDPVFGLARHNATESFLFALTNGRLLSVPFPLTLQPANIRMLKPSGQDDDSWSPTALIAKYISIRKVLPQTDGSYLVLGESKNSRSLLSRFNPNGSKDDSFLEVEPDIGVLTDVTAREDGSLVVVGSFRLPNSQFLQEWTLLSKEGAVVDGLPSFSSLAVMDSGSASMAVEPTAVSVTSDGTFVVSGYFVSALDHAQKGVVAYKFGKGNVPLTVTPLSGVSTSGRALLQASVYDSATDSVVISGYFNRLSDGSVSLGLLKYHGSSLDPIEAKGTALSAGKARKVVELNAGDLLVSGEFTHVNGVPSRGLVRLSGKGLIQRTFDISSNRIFCVRDFDLTSGGKIVAVGEFNKVQGRSVNGIVRLNTDGTVDDTFETGAGFQLANFESAAFISVLSDDSFYVGGIFRSYNSLPVSSFCRLLPSGKLDTSFAAKSSTYNAVSGLQVDSKKNAYFLTTYGEEVQNGIDTTFSGLVKVAPSGTRSKAFTADSSNSPAQGDLVLLPDGSLLVFSSLGGATKLDGNGTVVAGYPAGIGVNCVGEGAISLSDSSVLCVGRGANGETVFKLKANGDLDTNFSVGDLQLSGFADLYPSTLSHGHHPLASSGGGVYLPGFDGLTSTFSSIGLARMTSGSDPRPRITRVSSNVVVKSGSTARLSVETASDFPVYYQWYAENSDGSYSPIPGAESATYTSGAITRPTHFRVKLGSFATNEALSIEGSASVTLGTEPSFATSLPASVRLAPGGDLSLASVATADPAPSYQWYYNGVAIDGATAASFSKATLKASDSGVYSVKATNAVGSVESAAVVLVTSDATSPVVVSQPLSHTVTPGGTVVFSADAQTALQTIRLPALGDIRSTLTSSNLFGISLSYQWLKNGVAILGATKSTLVLHGVTADDTGSYQCLITSDLGSVLSSAGVLTLAADNNVSYLSNISIRSVTSEGSGTLIMGFVVGGTGTSGNKQVLVRGNGPSLDLFEVKGFIPDPVLAVYDNAKTLVAQNQGWNSASNADAIASAVASVGAYPIAPTSKDSAALLTVQAGPFSAHVREANGVEGVALAEVYDATPAAQMTTTSPRLVNISGRVLTGSGARTLIAGFVVAGSSAKTVLIRGAGPVLSVFEVPGFLPDPKLTLFDNNKAVVASNQGWGGDAEIKAAASSVGAFSWGDAATLDSALLVTLEPGAYTAQVSGATGDSGVALVEIYELP